jgi:hypothetical protein
MNTNSVAKLYPQLTPRERLPLIFAASARGDEAERDRLVRAAPKKAYQVPHHFGLADGVQMQVMFHLLRMLDVVGMFWLGTWLVADAEDFPGPEGKARLGRMRGFVRALAYSFTIHADGWKRFCESWQLDGEELLNSLPGYGTVQAAEEYVRSMAFTAEEATDWIRRSGGNPTANAATAEDVAAGMQAFVERRAEWWG